MFLEWILNPQSWLTATLFFVGPGIQPQHLPTQEEPPAKNRAVASQDLKTELELIQLIELSEPGWASTELTEEERVQLQDPSSELFHGQTDYLNKDHLHAEGGVEPEISDLHVLTDHENKVSDEFEVPKGLQERTRFWLQIYTRYSTLQTVIYDWKHPSLVYEVLDFSELREEARNEVVYEILRERRLKRTLAHYRKAFRELRRRERGLRKRSQSIWVEEKMLRIRAALAQNPLPHKHNMLSLRKSLKIQKGQRDNIVLGLYEADSHFPVMEEIFMEYGLPAELTRITLVESSFNPKAISSAGARGVWQFMPKTGKKFLYINKRRRVDERDSPLKSTVAAAKLLRQNHQILKTWPMAITAYNSGMRILKVSAKKRDVNLLDGCNGTRYLGRAGKNYYSEFLAILHATAYREYYYGLPNVNPLPDVEFKRLRRSMSARQFARRNGISLRELRRYNPEIRNTKRRMPRGFQFVIPVTDET